MSMDFAELSQCVTTVTKGEVREEATQLYSVWKVFWVYIQDGTCRLENTPVQAVAHPRVLWTSSLPGRPQHVVGGIPTSKPYKQTWKDIHICSTILCMFFQVRCTKNIVAYWMLAWAQCHCSSDKLFLMALKTIRDTSGFLPLLASREISNFLHEQDIFREALNMSVGFVTSRCVMSAWEGPASTLLRKSLLIPPSGSRPSTAKDRGSTSHLF